MGAGSAAASRRVFCDAWWRGKGGLCLDSLDAPYFPRPRSTQTLGIWTRSAALQSKGDSLQQHVIAAPSYGLSRYENVFIGFFHGVSYLPIQKVP